MQFLPPMTGNGISIPPIYHLGDGLLLFYHVLPCFTMFYPHYDNPIKMDVNLGYPHTRKPPFVDTPGEADRVNG